MLAFYDYFFYYQWKIKARTSELSKFKAKHFEKLRKIQYSGDLFFLNLMFFFEQIMMAWSEFFDRSQFSNYIIWHNSLRNYQVRFAQFTINAIIKSVYIYFFQQFQRCIPSQTILVLCIFEIYTIFKNWNEKMLDLKFFLYNIGNTQALHTLIFSSLFLSTITT